MAQFGNTTEGKDKTMNAIDRAVAELRAKNIPVVKRSRVTPTIPEAPLHRRPVTDGPRRTRSEAFQDVFDHCALKNISHRALAKASDVTLQAIHKVYYGNGSMTLKSLEKVCDTLDLELRIKPKHELRNPADVHKEFVMRAKDTLDYIQTTQETIARMSADLDELLHELGGRHLTGGSQSKQAKVADAVPLRLSGAQGALR